VFNNLADFVQKGSHKKIVFSQILDIVPKNGRGGYRKNKEQPKFGLGHVNIFN
jgi:hypothetical protein